MKALAIDFGSARIGVAGSDDFGILAHPLETIAATPQKPALQRIGELAAKRKAAMVVVGLPVRMDGSEGPSAVKVKAFATALRPYLADNVVIHFQDEYRSTEEAKSRLRSAGRKEKKQKDVIDQASAVVILQEFLDWHNGPAKLLASLEAAEE
jgi:putative Holliday junction resolvase